ncbi:hypothetical protein [Anaeromyxobacter terrae]|uniref:hypothetical protein n=1 Tax=Anaeromyxobacter terrae TaxID=2925406 RepID=UPI001F586090|nr:hypothetical protein [Anaeromyxobacter sp. SG22]
MTSRSAPRRIAAAAALALTAALLAGARPARAGGDNVIVSGSVYVDYWGIERRDIAARTPRSISPDASLKVQVDVHDDLAFSAKACFSCHGIDLEHAYLDYTPKTWFNVQVGRIAVPFGEYANRVDQSGHKTASAPLIYDMGRMAYGEKNAMNLGVIPQPYSDTGALLYGITWLGESLQVWYGLYGVAGMRGSNDLDFTSLRTVYYTDNNDQPAGGARVAVTWASSGKGFFGDVSVGASATGGRYDRAAKLDYAAVGADASMKLGPVTFRGEYAARRTDVDTSANGYKWAIVDPFVVKEGWYGEIEHPLGKHVDMVYRYDELRRKGVPLPGSILTPDSLLVRYTAGLVLTPAQAVYVKLAWEYWSDETMIGTPPGTTPFQDFHSIHLGFGGAF